MEPLTRLFMRNLWLWKAGLPEEPVYPTPKTTVAKMKNWWCEEFVQLQKNRRFVGCLRYGERDTVGSTKYNPLAEAHKRIDLYAADGNLEHLVDAANYCQIEFQYSTHPLKHFTSHDDAFHAKEVLT